MPRAWTDFDTSYTALILQFTQTGLVILGPFPRKRALGLRTDLYRFRDAVRAAIKSCAATGDFPIGELYDINEAFVVMTTSLDRADPRSTADSFTLTLQRDPMSDWKPAPAAETVGVKA